MKGRKLKLSFSWHQGHRQSSKTKNLLPSKWRVTTPTATAATREVSPINRSISPLASHLVSWNPCKELQTWLVVPVSIHQVPMVQANKHDSVTRQIGILEDWPFWVLALYLGRSLFQCPTWPQVTTGEALVFRICLTFFFLLLWDTCYLGAFFFFLFLFAEEEEDPFSITCTLLAWPRIPSAAYSSLRNSAKE